MTFKIIWSEFAETQLDDIFDYYEKAANIKVAKRLIKEIIQSPDKLKDAPNLGQVEPLLVKRNIQYRYLVTKNFKLIYSVGTQNRCIKIADVFDTRQNPTKMKRLK